MAKPKDDDTTRTFVKKLTDGTVLERTVTSAPGSEVNARFDGFIPKDSGSSTSSHASGATGTKPAGASSS
jgi:hypothetical protein